MNFDVNFPENNIHFAVEMEQMVERDIHKKTICQNGVYDAGAEGAQGYNPVVVNVPTYEEENARLNEELAEREAQLQAEQIALDSVIMRTLSHLSNHRVTKLPDYVFHYWENLKTVDLPNVTYVGTRSFLFSGITVVDFPRLRTLYGKLSFAYCRGLKTFVLRHSAVVPLSYTDCFLDSPIEKGAGFVYVPDELVEAYKTATNWSAFANQIKPISELEA